MPFPQEKQKLPMEIPSLSPCRTEIQRAAEDAAQPWLMCPTSCTSVKEKKGDAEYLPLRHESMF